MYIHRKIFLLVIIILLLTACAQQKVSSSKNTEEEKRALFMKTGAPFLDGMGDYEHLITTDQPNVQRYFNQGLVLSFAFNHAESVRSFRAAQALDRGCAMCFWGEALALGPNINVTSNGQVVMAGDAREQAYAAIQEAIRLKHGVSEKERDYIDALATRYNGDVATSRRHLDLAYMEAMRQLYQKYPQDDDVAALFAESMMNTMPWDYWADPDTPKDLTVEVIAVLETALNRSPQHPLAIHLYIHAVEASSTPERAERAADTLRYLVPGAGHLVHMPSHIYWRVGRYDDAAKANIKAVAADEAYIAACKAQGFYPAAYYPHNLHFLWAAYNMEGRSQMAIKTARKVAASVPLEVIEHFPVVEFFKTIPLLALTNFGQWGALLTEPRPSKHLVFSNAIWHYARAIAYANLADLDAARAEYAKLVSLREADDIVKLDTLGYPASMLLHIADALVHGEINMLDGKSAEAMTSFKTAVTIQDQLPYTEPPFWYYPTRHTLGKALLELGDGKQAEAVYRENLQRYPKNGWGLYGLMQSLEMQRKDSSEARELFEKVWRHADVQLSASRF
jgi:tetratricopeptide (TPR) repeat protein